VRKPSDADDRSDRSATFERLFRAEYQAVADYIGRRTNADLVDDLVDEVFLVAWRRLDRVPAEPRPWLLAVARNVLGTHIRGARRARALSARLAMNDANRTAPPPSSVGSEVLDAIAALAPKDREALLLVNWEGLSPNQAAQVLGERSATFRMRLHRARVRLRRRLEMSGDEPDSVAATEEVTSA
jgi:RNA polymerase sigma factor (sigma-70 family)